ncbi:MAG TPA: hypothetical protein VF585_01030 [Chthoniobacterales bacterium]|jgi:hypothetical protein
MEYPLHLSFKILALAPQILITDAAGRSVFYVKQKLFKFREAVQIYKDDSRSQHVYDINADRVIDWSARYTFSLPSGETVGAVKRSGMRSLFAAHYTVLDAKGMPLFELEQTKPWAGVLDSLLGEIPIVGIFSGYFLNPVYSVKRATSSEVVMHLIKKRSFLESGFTITRETVALEEGEESLVLLSAIMVTLLERERS